MKKQIIIGIIIIMVMLLIPNCSKAVEASRFEAKSGGTMWNNVTISRAYQECYDLREEEAESTLGKNTLDPHLTLNKDWGAVAYLTISDYGNGTGATSTTTGNNTGVMEFGKNFEWTSSFITGAVNSSVHPEYRTNLTDNKGTRYVERLEKDANTSFEHSKGMALAETSPLASPKYWTVSYPCFVRKGVIGFGYNNETFNERAVRRQKLRSDQQFGTNRKKCKLSRQKLRKILISNEQLFSNKKETLKKLRGRPKIGTRKQEFQ